MSLAETAVYISLWAVIFAGFGFDEPPAVMTLLFLFLPGALLAGPLGLFVWGRHAFIPAALIGTVVWFILLVLPAIQAVRE